MPNVLRLGLLILMIAGLVAGCSKATAKNEEEGDRPNKVEPSIEDKLAKEQIDILDRLAAEFDKVTDKESLAQIQPEVKNLSDRLSRTTQEFQTLAAPKREAAMNANMAELQTASARMRTARDKAYKAAWNKPAP